MTFRVIGKSACRHKQPAGAFIYCKSLFFIGNLRVIRLQGFHRKRTGTLYVSDPLNSSHRSRHGRDIRNFALDRRFADIAVVRSSSFLPIGVFTMMETSRLVMISSTFGRPSADFGNLPGRNSQRCDGGIGSAGGVNLKAAFVEASGHCLQLGLIPDR